MGHVLNLTLFCLAFFGTAGTLAACLLMLLGAAMSDDSSVAAQTEERALKIFVVGMTLSVLLWVGWWVWFGHA